MSDLPSVRDSDHEIREWARQRAYGVKTIHVELSEAASQDTPDMATVQFEQPGEPVTRWKLAAIFDSGEVERRC